MYIGHWELGAVVNPLERRGDPVHGTSVLWNTASQIPPTASYVTDIRVQAGNEG